MFEIVDYLIIIMLVIIIFNGNISKLREHLKIYSTLLKSQSIKQENSQLNKIVQRLYGNGDNIP